MDDDTMSADNDDELQRLRERIHDLSDVVQATVTKHATMALGVEHLVEGFKEHRADSKAFMRETVEELRAIREQTTATNGRVNVLEAKMERRGHAHDMRRSSDKAEAITVTIPAGVVSAKTVTMVISGVIAGLIAAWKAGLFA